MANTFGYCKKCQIYGEPPRFIDVNPEHNVIICPKCGTRMTPKQAITNYDNYFENLYKEAEILLFRARNYMGSYKAYARIIDYRPNDVVARYGRILSLVYLSTLRHTYFNESILMFTEERKKYLRSQKYRGQYLVFINEVNKAIDKYKASMKKRIAYKTVDGREFFYDKDCVSLYCHRLVQIKNFKSVLLEECNYLNKKLEDQSFAPLIETLTKEVSDVDEILKEKMTDIEGYRYTFSRVSKNDEPIIGRADTKDLKVPTKVKRKSLVEKKENSSEINDSIYFGTRIAYILAKLAIPLFFICVISSGIFFILSASFKNAALVFQILGTVVLVIGVIGILLHGVWNIACRLSNNYKIYVKEVTKVKFKK